MSNNPNIHSTPENEPAKPELTADMSREDLIAYYRGQADRAAEINAAQGNENNSWAGEAGVIRSSATLDELLNKVTNDPSYEPSETDVLLAQFVDADLKETSALNSIDEDALMNAYKDKAATVNEAVLLHIDKVKDVLATHNNKIENKLQNNTRFDASASVPHNPVRPLSSRDKKRLSGNKRNNNKIIGDIREANTLLKSNNLTMDAATFLDVVDRHARGEIDNETFEHAKTELESNTVTLNRAADAYMLVSGDEENDFQDHTFIEALNLNEDTNRNEAISSQRKARAAAEQARGEGEGSDTDTGMDTDTDESDAAEPQEDLDAVEHRLRGRLGLDSETTDDAEPPATPPATPPAGNSQPQGPNLNYDQRAKAAERQADVDNYTVALTEFARRKANKTDAPQDLQNYQSAIQRLMASDDEYKELLDDNVSIRPEAREALINQYYVSKFGELRKATSAHEAAHHEKGFSAFAVRHRRMIKVGGYLLAGASAVTGNVAGAIFFGALTKGVTAGAQHHDKKAKEFFAADSGEAGTASFINSARSLDAIRDSGAVQGNNIAQAAFDKLMRDHDEQFTDVYEKARLKRAIGGWAVGGAWFGGILLGGHMGAQFLDYQAHGDGGFMDKLNHLDDPNGATPWRATVDKPWWLNSATPWALTIGGGVGLAVKKSLAEKKKAQKKRNNHPRTSVSV